MSVVCVVPTVVIVAVRRMSVIMLSGSSLHRAGNESSEGTSAH